MSGSFERTFVVKVPVERAWNAFVDVEGREAWMVPPGHDQLENPEAGWPGAGGTPMQVEIGKVKPHRLLQWRQTARPNEKDPGWVDMTVTFEEIESGTRITLTQSGFGDTPEWKLWTESVSLGTDESIADLILYLETGVRAVRHHSYRSAIGAVLTATPPGLRVVRVIPGGYAAQAGIQEGDILVRLGGGAIFNRSDVSFVERAHAPGTEVEVEFVRGNVLHSGHAPLSEAFFSSRPAA